MPRSDRRYVLESGEPVNLTHEAHTQPSCRYHIIQLPLLQIFHSSIRINGMRFRLASPTSVILNALRGCCPSLGANFDIASSAVIYCFLFCHPRGPARFGVSIFVEKSDGGIACLAILTLRLCVAIIKYLPQGLLISRKW